MHSFFSKTKLIIFFFKTSLLHKFTFFLLTAISALTISSCSFFIFPEFSITEYSRTDNSIIIKFSSLPELYSIQKSISLTKDDNSEEYSIVLNEKTLTIFLTSGFESNRLYTLSINTDAEDKNGNSLSSDFKWNISTKESDIRPEVNSFENLETSLTFNFNTPIKRNAFSSCFSISPSIDYFLYFQNDDKTASVIFEEPLKNNERYIIKLTTDLENIYNNKLLEQYSNTFIHNQSDSAATYQLFSISENTSTELSTSAINENLLTDSKIKIIFSDKIDIASINSNIKITPPLDFTIAKNTESFSKATITFNETPDPQTEYTLSLSDKLKDNSNSILPSADYRLIFNNEQNKKISFLTALIIKDTETIPVSFSKNYQNIYFLPSEYPTADVGITNYIDILFCFSISKAARQIDYFSSIENIKISPTLNCIEIIPEEIQILSNSESLTYTSWLPSEYQENPEEYSNLSTVKFHCKIKNKNTSGLINFSINKNLSDNLQNTLQDSVSLTVNKR